MADYTAEWVEVQQDKARWRWAILLTLAFVATLWLVRAMQDALGLDLGRFGVHPREWTGLLGIVLAPFIHGSWTHLMSNTPPLLILGTTLLYGYPKAARLAIPALFLGAGLGVWLFGRASYHIGASGLTFGMMTFVFAMGVLRWDRRSIGLALVVFLLYGGMIAGLAPSEAEISYESHIAGAVTGIVLAALLRKLDPKPVEKRYSWEVEPAEEEGMEEDPLEARPADVRPMPVSPHVGERIAGEDPTNRH